MSTNPWYLTPNGWYRNSTYGTYRPPANPYRAQGSHHKYYACEPGRPLFPSQNKFFWSRERFQGFSGPVGTGKSKAIASRSIWYALHNPNCVGLVGAPTYRMLEDTTKSAVLETLEISGVPFKPIANQNAIYFPQTKSKIIFRSLDRPDKLVGTNLAWFAVDELTYCKEAAWEKLEARLREPKSKYLSGFAVWTPKGYDWVYKRFINEQTRKKMHAAVRADPAENKAILDAVPDFYERLKESYDERLYRQEALGEYLNINSGAVYYAFDRTKNIATSFFDFASPLYWAIDFNVDPMCSVICQVSGTDYRQRGTLRVIDQVVMRNANTASLCLQFVAQTQKWASTNRPLKVRVYGDHTGHRRQTSGTGSDWEIITQFFANRRDYQIELCVPYEQNPPVRDRTNAVNSLLCSANGERHLVVDLEKCPVLVNDFEQVNWALSRSGGTSGEIEKGDLMLTHISDALGYLVYEEFGFKTAPSMGSGFFG